MKDVQATQRERVANLLESFIRVYPIAFNEEDFQKFARIAGVDCDLDLVTLQLRESTVVYRLPDGKYLARGSTLSDVYFSIKPSKYEVEHGILIIGDRCIPFMDPSIVPEGYEVYYGRCKIPLTRKVLTLPTSEVLDHYQLFGEEYAVQYINMDSCNQDIDLTGYDFVLPPSVNLSVIDIAQILKKTKFQYGDRFLFRMKNFLEAKMVMEVFSDHRNNPFKPTVAEEKREQWYQVLEKCLLETFDCFGPCRSIDEQLAYAFMLGMSSLNSMYCGSVTEFLQWTRKIEPTVFGVETRLWYTDRPISAVPQPVDENQCSDVSVEEELEITNEYGIPVTDLILQAFVRDSLWLQEEDGSAVYNRLILDEDVLIPAQSTLLKLHLENLHAILKESYNRFTDRTLGSVRHAAVVLYAQLLEFMCYMSQSKVPADVLPQQDFVIFSQIWGHVSKMLEEFEKHQDLDGLDCTNACKSIEGMSWSASDVTPRLRRAVDDWKRQSFSYI